MKLNEIKHKSGWKSKDLYQDNSWKYTINATEVKELDDALRHAKSCELTSLKFDKKHFPLPALSKVLNNISDVLENGTGVFLLRGIPVSQYTKDEIKLIYAGIGAHLGVLLRQSKSGELIGDVGDTGKNLKDKSGRGTTTSDPLPFHTDRSDVVSLLCTKQAKKGGQSRVVSSVAIHNEILKNRPDLLEVLYQPFNNARVAWETGEENSHYPIPVFSIHDGHFATRYLRHFINISQDIPGLPKLTSAQVEALDLVEKLADNPEFCADMEFQPGDVQFLNNFVSLHSRAGYEDHLNAEDKRHLYRLWLSVPNSRPLSPEFEPLYTKTGAGEVRGGVPELINS